MSSPLVTVLRDCRTASMQASVAAAVSTGGVVLGAAVVVAGLVSTGGVSLLLQAVRARRSPVVAMACLMRIGSACRACGGGVGGVSVS